MRVAFTNLDELRKSRSNAISPTPVNDGSILLRKSMQHLNYVLVGFDYRKTQRMPRGCVLVYQ